MIREEKNALILLVLFVVGAFVLYVFVLKPTLEGAIELPGGGKANAASEETPPADPILDDRPKSAKRMVTARANLRDAATGLPVSGVTAKVIGVEDIADPQTREISEGVLLVEYLPPDAQFSVEFRRDGYTSRLLHQLRGPAKQTLELGVVALVPERSITGDVRDRKGKAIANVKVGAFVASEAAAADDVFERARQLAEAIRQSPIAVATTDADGRFKLNQLEPRNYVIQFFSEEFAPTVLPHVDTQFADGRVRVELDTGSAARARVTLEDGKFPKGAIVTLVAAEMPQDVALSAGQAEVTSDGALALRALAPGPHFVFVGGGGAATCGIGPLSLPSDHEIKITVPRGVEAQGVVTDVHGVPVKEARIEARGAQRGAIRSVTKTDANGRWKLTGLPVGATRIRVSARGYATDEQSVPVASLGAEHPTQLYRGGTLIGTITADGKPVLGARVSIPTQDQRTVSDEHGQVKLEGLSAGKTTIDCEAVGFTATHQIVDLALGRPTEVRFGLERGGEVRVKVHDGADAAIADSRLLVVRVAEDDRPIVSECWFADSDSLGFARCRDLENGLRFMIVASHAGYAPARSEGFVLGPEHLKRGFAILLPSSGSIAGNLVDDQGAPVAGALVRVESFLDDPITDLLLGRVRSQVLSTAEGAFEFRDLPAGEYRVVAQAVGFRRVLSPKVAVPAGERRIGVKLTMLPTRPVFGSIATADGRPVPMAKISLTAKGLPPQVELATDYAGRFYFLSPDSRPFTLHAEATNVGQGELKIEGDAPAPPFKITIDQQ